MTEVWAGSALEEALDEARAAVGLDPSEALRGLAWIDDQLANEAALTSDERIVLHADRRSLLKFIRFS